ncbi:MAG: endonuclease domain-containing protein [Pseudomonas sp.]|uniref:endonuclease domain-containing protein n=1 Tax=Pseudomonas sp. TaxID=306 RepID=UPI003D112291
MPSRHKPLPEWHKQRARELRSSATDAEARLWYYLRAGRLAGLKFRRQHPMPPYIADFYCDAAKLIVELDGSQHGGEEDVRRTLNLEAQGVTVLRFWNDQLLKETEAVLREIHRVASERIALLTR